jgi:chromosome segregation ATPase
MADKTFEQEVDEYNKSLQDSMQLSLKDHLDKLEGEVKKMLDALETSQREILTVKKEFTDFDREYHQSNQNFAGMIEKKMDLLAEDFKRLIRESRGDLAFLRNQLESSVQEANTLEELTKQLEDKIYVNESFIGFGHLPEDEQVPEDDQTL